jgi:hypothetical protein
MKSAQIKNLLRIPEHGNGMALYTNSAYPISKGFNRVVFGDRGPYVEILDTQIIMTNIHIPITQLYRLTDLRIYYVEFRSNDVANIKIYYQIKTVAYADYKIGHFYVDVFDLCLESGIRIVKDDTSNDKSVDFFEL